MSESKNIEISEYNRYWTEGKESYSAEKTGYTPHFLNFMSQLLSKAPPKSRVLDLGCGDGFFSFALAKFDVQVTGIDLSDAGIATATSRGMPNAQFMTCDIQQKLPFSESSFDYIWCSEVLEHLFSPKAVIEEGYRILSNGGYFIATVPYHGLIKNIGIALFAFDRHYDPTYPHLRFFTKNSISKLLKDVGFEIVSIETCGSGLGLRDLVVPTNILLVAKKSL